jgi:hypothetical protein
MPVELYKIRWIWDSLTCFQLDQLTVTYQEIRYTHITTRKTPTTKNSINRALCCTCATIKPMELWYSQLWDQAWPLTHLYCSSLLIRRTTYKTSHSVTITINLRKVFSKLTTLRRCLMEIWKDRMKMTEKMHLINWKMSHKCIRFNQKMKRTHSSTDETHKRSSET